MQATPLEVIEAPGSEEHWGRIGKPGEWAVGHDRCLRKVICSQIIASSSNGSSYRLRERWGRSDTWEGNYILTFPNEESAREYFQPNTNPNQERTSYTPVKQRPNRHRPDRGPRINRAIRVPEVRVVNEERTLNRVLPTKEAQELAQNAGLDLIEIAPKAKPPVCVIMALSKWKYQQKQEEKKQRQAKQPPLKEIKLSPNIAEGDLSYKVQHIKDFLEKHHPVKVSLFFKGRQFEHRDIGFDLLKRVIAELESCAKVGVPPRMQGRSLSMQLNPLSH